MPHFSSPKHCICLAPIQLPNAEIRSENTRKVRCLPSHIEHYCRKFTQWQCYSPKYQKGRRKQEKCMLTFKQDICGNKGTNPNTMHFITKPQYFFHNNTFNIHGFSKIGKCDKCKGCWNFSQSQFTRLYYLHFYHGDISGGTDFLVGVGSAGV